MTGAHPTAFLSLQISLEAANASAGSRAALGEIALCMDDVDEVAAAIESLPSFPKHSLMHSMLSLSMSLSVTSHILATTYWAPPSK